MTDKFTQALVKAFGGSFILPLPKPTNITLEVARCFMKRIDKKCPLLGEADWATCPKCEVSNELSGKNR